MLTYRVTEEVIRGSESIPKTVEITGEGALDREVDAPTGETTEIALAFTAAGLGLFWFVSDQDGILRTNDGASTEAADDEFAIEAGKPLRWYDGCGLPIAKMFSADVTALFFVNASGEAAALRIRGVADATPA